MILDLVTGEELPDVDTVLDRIETDRIAGQLEIRPGDRLEISVNVRSQVAA